MISLVIFSLALLLSGLLLMVDAIFFYQFCFTLTFAHVRTDIVEVSITFFVDARTVIVQ